MPIPGSILSIVFDPMSCIDMYPSLCTLRPNTRSTNSAGQKTNTYADSTDPNYIDVPCRKSPLILVRPQQQENDKGQNQTVVADFQLNLIKYIPLSEVVLNQYQVKVDGIVYQIVATEDDGSHLTTRFKIAVISPYNA